MKKIITSIIIVFTLSSLIIVSCENDKNTPELLVFPDSIPFTQEATSTTIAILSAHVEWTVTSSDPSWCTVDPTSGTGHANITVEVSANTTTAIRSATITVAGGSLPNGIVAITQTGEEKVLTISENSLSFGATEPSQTITITANVPWTAASDQSWCTLSPESGNGSAVLSITTTDNTSAASLSAIVTVSSELGDETIAITKRGAGEELIVSPVGALELSAMGLTKEITVTANLPWTVVSNQSWCTVSSASGSGNGTLTFTTTNNTTADVRTATIVIAGGATSSETITITQWPYGRTSDSLALVTLYHATNGPTSWNTKWNLANPVTTWAGLEWWTQGGELRAGRVQLWTNNLSGSIPPEIGNLTGLVRFAVQSNTIGGTLPQEIGLLTNLVDLMVAENNIDGPFPYSIGNLIDLTTVYMDKNNFTGIIPASFANLINLNVITINGNRIEGVAQEVIDVPYVWDKIWNGGLCNQQPGYTPHPDCP